MVHYIEFLVHGSLTMHDTHNNIIRSSYTWNINFMLSFMLLNFSDDLQRHVNFLKVMMSKTKHVFVVSVSVDRLKEARCEDKCLHVTTLSVTALQRLLAQVRALSQLIQVTITCKWF
jgi:hypothetical protein